ncbi:hypothetical protein PTTG_02945 [Puccinia triticina 1-1 BBBD Race 1]|uniref:Uncharacterized protein n=1 Tax=Puccinia triticina (isolate 1-1 / race 1 (BBBD)) TaxID=630390 RepID=A0A180GV85_PUCT1|nr:hypothetical protein PTTG_02945 [Puccinia triticina 1-1 BBBD Race 1]
MLRKFSILLVIGIVFPVSAKFGERVNEATIIHESGGQAGPELQPARSGGSTSSSDRPAVGSQQPLAPPTADRRQADGAYNSAVRHLAQGPAPPQRVLYHAPAPAPASATSAGYQQGPHGTSSALLHQSPPVQAGARPAHHQQNPGPSAVPLHASPANHEYQQGSSISATVYHQFLPAIPGGQVGVGPAVPMGISGRQAGPTSYQQGTVQCAGHSQAFPGSPAGQASAVPRYQQQVAGPSAVSLQSSSITSSHVGPPTRTASDARPAEHGQINDPRTQSTLNPNTVAEIPANPPSQPGK